MAVKAKETYAFLRWNGSFGNQARFIVQDLANEKQALFTPGRARDIAWTDKNLADGGEYKEWDDFGHEKIDVSLEEVVF